MACDVPRQIILLILPILLNCNFDDATEIEWKTNPNIIAIESHSNYKYDNIKKDRELEDSYFVQNIGRDSIIVTAGGVFSSRKIVEPTYSKIFDRRNMRQFCNYLKIINNKRTRAFVYISKDPNPNQYDYPPKTYDVLKILDKAFTLGVRKISNLDGGLSVLLNAFWPENKNVWHQLYEILKVFMKGDSQKNILNIINQDIERIKNRIADLNSKCTSSNKNDIASIYMKIAEYLVGLENKFIISRKADHDYSITNFCIVPLYTNIVTMKIHFYAIGIVKREMFQLDDDNVKTIEKYIRAVILNPKATDAIIYLKQMYKNAIDIMYKYVYPGALYNVLMVLRTHLVLHAMEMIPIWKQTGLNPSSNEIPYIDAVSYSYFYGRPSPNLYQQAAPTIVPAPLNPPLDKDKRVKLLSIIFYMCIDDYNKPGIVRGVELKFESNNTFVMGDKSDKMEQLDLDKKTIQKLEVDGDEILKYFKFTLSDETTKTFGKQSSIKPATFELEDHHIISLYVANDLERGFIDNIAVSFARDY